MKKLFRISLLLWFASVAAAQESTAPKAPKVLCVYGWTNLVAQIPDSQVISMDGFSVLKIENTNYSRLELVLLTITNSSLIKKVGAFSCEIKYENVLGTTVVSTNSSGPVPGRIYGPWRSGELKLAETFPPDSVGGDETKSQADASFEGKSNWIPLQPQLKVFRNASGILPLKIELDLHLQSKGTVYLRPIRLLGETGGTNWWSPERAGMVGGIGGAIIGCLGGLIGLLAGKGKARNFVLATIKIFIALGILSLIAGVIAIVSGQPYAVWYPLLLPGFILTLVFSLNLPSIQRRYDELEIRRMTSMDATGN